MKRYLADHEVIDGTAVVQIFFVLHLVVSLLIFAIKSMTGEIIRWIPWISATMMPLIVTNIKNK